VALRHEIGTESNAAGSIYPAEYQDIGLGPTKTRDKAEGESFWRSSER